MFFFYMRSEMHPRTVPPDEEGFFLPDCPPDEILGRRHGLIVNADSERLKAFQEETRKYVRLSFGMTPPPR